MYPNATSFERLMNLSWDLFVIAVIILFVFSIFAALIKSTGLPQYYVEKYILTLAVSVISYQFFFTTLYISGNQDTLHLFSFPIMKLNYLDSSHFLEQSVVYICSSLFIFVFLLLITTPFLSLFIELYKNEVEFRFNKVLIEPYIKTLLLITLVSMIPLYFYMVI